MFLWCCKRSQGWSIGAGSSWERHLHGSECQETAGLRRGDLMCRTGARDVPLLRSPLGCCGSIHTLHRARMKQSRWEERRTCFISRGEAKKTLWVSVLQCQALQGKERKHRFLNLPHGRRVGLHSAASAKSRESSRALSPGIPAHHNI